MKIAAVTEDEISISQHFGRAPLYTVVTVQDGKVVSKEVRAKAGHHTFAAHHAELAPGERHGYDAGAQTRHASMIENIADCVYSLIFTDFSGRDLDKVEAIIDVVSDIIKRKHSPARIREQIKQLKTDSDVEMISFTLNRMRNLCVDVLEIMMDIDFNKRFFGEGKSSPIT